MNRGSPDHAKYRFVDTLDAGEKADSLTDNRTGVDAANLTATQAARLAAILPAPKERSASNPSSFTRNRTAQIIQGADTIAADGRAACFER